MPIMTENVIYAINTVRFIRSASDEIGKNRLIA